MQNDRQGRDNLIDFVEHVAGEGFLRVEEDLGHGFVRLNTDEAERRQAKHDIRSVEDILIELLRNARDVGARHVFVALTKDAANQRYLTVIDDGDGVPQEFKELIFEPRVTTKLDKLIEDDFGIHGRGMALYAIKQRAQSAKLVYSSINQGSSFKVVIDVTQLKERNDQSTYPTIELDDADNWVCKGIKNIPRIVVEFALRSPDVKYFLGSPTEILATMHVLSKSDTRPSAIDRYRDDKPKALWELAGSTNDVKSFATLAENFYGLQLSDRNIYRIINGDISPMEAINPGNYRNVLRRQNIKTSKRRMIENYAKIFEDEDLEYVSLQALRAVNVVGSKYFLRAQRRPEVKREADKIKITLFLEKTE